LEINMNPIVSRGMDRSQSALGMSEVYRIAGDGERGSVHRAVDRADRRPRRDLGRLG